MAKLLTLPEFCHATGAPYFKTWQRCVAAELPAVRRRGRWYINLDAVQRLARRAQRTARVAR